MKSRVILFPTVLDVNHLSVQRPHAVRVPRRQARRRHLGCQGIAMLCSSHPYLLRHGSKVQDAGDSNSPQRRPKALPLSERMKVPQLRKEKKN